MGLGQARAKLENGLANALAYGERVVRVVHGRGKHSEAFPVLKSFVRRWLEESDFARERVEAVFRGEDGSPYTRPNAGETVVVLRMGNAGAIRESPVLEGDDEEYREARRHAKGMCADRLRKARRRRP